VGAVSGPDIAQVAALLGDPSRAAMCLALLDGRFHTAGELAGAAGVAASTASEHLGRLLDGGLVEATRQGRHRYFRLAGPDVASALEALGVLARPTPVRSLREATTDRRLRAGRTCYDHLAGALGVALTDALATLGVITPEFALSDLTPLAGLDLALPAGRRPLLRPCLDWTERRHHAAGALPAAMTGRFLELAWLERVAGSRAVRVTSTGHPHLCEIFGADALTTAAA
jgi:DNA-binding transcriptional ArsR family regulator